HLEGQGGGEVLLALRGQVARTTEQLAALARRRRGPRVLRGHCGIECTKAVGDRGIRDLLDRLARRGVGDPGGLAALGRYPLAPDGEAVGDAVEERGFRGVLQ